MERNQDKDFIIEDQSKERLTLRVVRILGLYKAKERFDGRSIEDQADIYDQQIKESIE